MNELYQHRWSGWPGAFCLKCGVWDYMEYAIGNNYYDPITDVWESDELEEKFGNQPLCLFSDEEYEEKLK